MPYALSPSSAFGTFFPRPRGRRVSEMEFIATTHGFKIPRPAKGEPERSESKGRWGLSRNDDRDPERDEQARDDPAEYDFVDLSEDRLAEKCPDHHAYAGGEDDGP